MLTVTDWAKTVTDTKGRLMVMAVAQALSDYRAWPLLKFLTFNKVLGSAYLANRAGASAAGATRALGSEFTESSPTVAQYTFPLRAAGGQIKIDKVMVQADTSGVVEAGLLTRKLWDIGARLNRMFFNGDGTDVGGAQFTGVNKFCADEGRVTHVGGPITSDLLDDALTKTPGANCLLANAKLSYQMHNLDQKVSKQIILNDGQPKPSMFDLNYKGCMILPVLQAPDDTTAVQADILPQTESDGASHNTASRITICRLGMDGLYGAQNDVMSIGSPYELGAMRIRDLSWFMAGVCSDMLDAVYQLDRVNLA